MGKRQPRGVGGLGCVAYMGGVGVGDLSQELGVSHEVRNRVRG